MVESMTKLNVRTVEDLARDVANDFNKTVEEEGFASFAEMKKSYMWDSADVKEEVRYMVNEMYGGQMYDDDEVRANNAERYMSYREFMKVVRKHLL
jgi:hypothetical protein